jgi:membrane protease YdiL (CAAX protease family)
VASLSLLSSKAIGLLILLFVAVYAPVFAVAGSLTRSSAMIVPLTIAISLAIAAGLIAFFIRGRGMSAAEFELCWSAPKYSVVALIVGLPFALVVTWCISHVREPDPLAGLSIPIGLSILYFGIGAPIQEEVIFRGLLQSVLRRSFALRDASAHAAPLIVAVLFGAIHLVVGPVTAVCALVLGVIAGELRLRSGSLLPAVIVHALFNLCGMFWPQS